MMAFPALEVRIEKDLALFGEENHEPEVINDLAEYITPLSILALNEIDTSLTRSEALSSPK